MTALSGRSITPLSQTSTPVDSSVPVRDDLPDMYDLPSESTEDPGLPDEFHDLQPQLLSRTLSLPTYADNNRFMASDMNLYYDFDYKGRYKRPDWFLVVDVPRLYQGKELRASFVTWKEGQVPRVIVEFLSYKTEKEDLDRFYRKSDEVPKDLGRGLVDPRLSMEQVEEAALRRITSDPTTPPRKLSVYEDYLKVQHYIVYSKYTQKLRYFRHNGRQYEERPVKDQAPLIWLPDLEIGLALWDDYFADLPGPWLRWCDADGNLFPTDTEQAQTEARQAQTEARQAQTEADQARTKVDRLAEKLRELGIDPDTV